MDDGQGKRIEWIQVVIASDLALAGERGNLTR